PGHISSQCKGHPRCLLCGKDKHINNEECPFIEDEENPLKCINCEGKHLATSSSCPLITQQRQINALAAAENLSYAEAKRKIRGGKLTTDPRSPLPLPPPLREGKSHRSLFNPTQKSQLEDQHHNLLVYPNGRAPASDATIIPSPSPFLPVSNSTINNNNYNNETVASSTPLFPNFSHPLLPLLQELAVTTNTFTPPEHSASSSEIKILQWNCRGLQDKLPNLQFLAKKFDIFCIQETLLTKVSKVSVNNFSLLRTDITKPGMRGICFLVKNNLKVSLVQLPFTVHYSIEAAAISIPFQNEELLIINIYRHPNDDTTIQAFNDIFNLASRYKFALIVGDFNAHHRLWGCKRNDSAGIRLASCIESFNYWALNDSSNTRFNPCNNTGSIIDLALASPDLACACCTTTLDDPMASDHYPVETVINGKFSMMKRLAYKLKLDKEQLLKLNARLEKISRESPPTTTDNELEDYEQLINSIKEVATDILREDGKDGKIGPKKIIYKRSPAPWWNGKCTKAVNNRKIALDIFKRDPSKDNYLALKRQNRECKLVLSKQKKESWRSFCTSFNSKTPTAEMWRLIKAFKRKDNNSIKDYKILESSQEAAIDKLCPPSCSPPPFTTLLSMKQEDINSPNVQSWMSNPFSIDELRVALATVKVSSSPGLDQISYAFIKTLPEKFETHLLDIYNRIISRGTFPSSWTESLVVFIPKPNSNGVRPISLLSCLLKILEKCVYNRLRWHFEANDILSDTQFGFRSYRSCSDSLIILTNAIQLGFINGKFTVCVFLDIAGAFDNVDPFILLEDLQRKGVPAVIRYFIANLLLNRNIFFVRDGNTQGPYYTYKGLPQGSILSPPLYNLYVKDSKRQLLPGVSRGLELSPAKSRCVVFTRKRTYQLPKPNILVNGEEIPMATEHRFLGINLDNKLTGKPHMKYLINKGKRIASILTMLAGTKWGSHPQLLLSLYRAVFRGAIEYGAVVFQFKGNKQLFLALQRLQWKLIRNAMGYRVSTPINEPREQAFTLRTCLSKSAVSFPLTFPLSQQRPGRFTKPCLSSTSYKSLQQSYSPTAVVAVTSGSKIKVAWIPSHKGITGNERADILAKRAARKGRKTSCMVPYIDLYHRSKYILNRRYQTYLENAASTKGTFYHTHYHTNNVKPWYYRLPLNRAQIVTTSRLRSGHYNLNQSLFRKNIVDSPSCPCGDPNATEPAHIYCLQALLTEHELNAYTDGYG
ncbi:hypothetical protein DBV15_10259, partial [Temnothorax longispinosus]